MSVTSVIIPTYNRALTIGRAIHSVLHQTVTDIELIVVDDGSNDGTCDIVTEIRDSRLKLIRNERRLGGSGARNVGIHAATGDLIAFQDSDDEWLVQKLQLQIKQLEESDQLSASCCSFVKVTSDGVERFPARDLQLEDEVHFDQLAFENLISTQTFLARRSPLLSVGLFDETLPKLQDWDLVLRFSERFKIGFISDPLVIVYDTPGNLSSFKKNELIAREAILQKWIGNASFTKSMEARQRYVISRLALREGNRVKSLQYAQQAVALQPGNPRYHLAFIQTTVAWNKS